MRGAPKSERRELQRAAENVATLGPEHVEQFSEHLTDELAELDETVGEAEDSAEEARERVALTNDFFDLVDQTTAELIEDHNDFAAWAIDEFGGVQEYHRWLSKQGDEDDQRKALTDLAEDYQADVEFHDWIGDDLLERLEQLPDHEYEQATRTLAQQFAAERNDEDEGDVSDANSDPNLWDEDDDE